MKRLRFYTREGGKFSVIDSQMSERMPMDLTDAVEVGPASRGREHRRKVNGVWPGPKLDRPADRPAGWLVLSAGLNIDVGQRDTQDRRPNTTESLNFTIHVSL